MNESPQEQDRRQLRGMWEWRSTEELLDVWQRNNRNEWRDEVFEVIGQILATRLGTVPPQGEPANRTPPQATRRTKWIALGLALIAMSFAAYLLFFRGNATGRVLRDEIQTITLTRSSHPKRLVYENDVVQISIGYDQFLVYIEDRLRDPETGSAGQETYQDWQAQTERIFHDSDVVQLTERNIELFVANMLQRGQAAVFDKRSQSYMNTITWRTLVETCGPLCGGGTYYFYLPDANLINPNGTQFLEAQYMWF